MKISKEAFTINGSYLENLISGYSTIKTIGRENLEKEIETIQNKRDGQTIKSTRFPARTIKIDFVLQGSSMNDLRNKLTTLNSILNQRDAVFVFDDEPDKYFVGTPVLSDEMDDIKNGARGTINLYCADPFKYAMSETQLQGQVIDGVLVLSGEEYDGYKAYPRINVEFATDETSGAVGSRADVGYILIAKDNTDYSLQFGDDEEKDTTSISRYNVDFTKISRSGWSDVVRDVPSDKYTIPTAAASTFSSTSGAYASAYGSASGKYHGPILTHSGGATNEFTLTWKQALACNNTASTGNKQGGAFGVFLYGTNNSLVYALTITKSGTTSLKGYVNLYDSVNGYRTVKSGVSLAYTGPLGFKSATGSARKSASTIKRYQGEDGLWYLSINTPLYTNDKIGGWETAPEITSVGFFFGKYGTNSTFAANRLYSAKLTDGNVDVANTFGSGDVLEIDTADMSVLLNGADASNLGDISNDWNGVTIEKGVPIFTAQWSEWVVAGFEPTVSIFYRKRWL